MKFWKTISKSQLWFGGLALLSLLVVAACGPAETDPVSEVESASTTDTDTAAYPGPAVQSAQGTATPDGYPGPAKIETFPEPPNPERSLPQAEPGNAVIGGVLIREIVGEGFIPLEPVALSLAEVLETSEGNPAYIRESADSPRAELFPTGIFIFRNIPPGEYGLMLDVGYTKYPINGEDGLPLIISVSADEQIDMGQIITELPSS